MEIDTCWSCGRYEILLDSSSPWISRILLKNLLAYLWWKMHAGLSCLRTLNEPLQHIQQHSPVVLKLPKATKKYNLKKKKTLIESLMRLSFSSTKCLISRDALAVTLLVWFLLLKRKDKSLIPKQSNLTWDKWLRTTFKRLEVEILSVNSSWCNPYLNVLIQMSLISMIWL